LPSAVQTSEQVSSEMDPRNMEMMNNMHGGGGMNNMNLGGSIDGGSHSSDSIVDMNSMGSSHNSHHGMAGM